MTFSIIVAYGGHYIWNWNLNGLLQELLWHNYGNNRDILYAMILIGIDWHWALIEGVLKKEK